MAGFLLGFALFVALCAVVGGLWVLFKQKVVVNEALRRGLSSGAQPPSATRYRVKVHKARILPGFDPAGFNRLADELEDQTILEKLAPAARKGRK